MLDPVPPSIPNPLPVAKGGTGAQSSAEALASLGAAAVVHTHAQADVDGLVAALAAKADLAGATFTGPVVAPLLDLGTTLGQKLYLYHSGTIRYGALIDSGVMNFFAGGAARVGFGSMSESDGASFTEYFSVAGDAPFARYWGSPASGSVGTEQTVSFIRAAAAGVSWPQVVDIKVGRHTAPSASAEPFTRLDIAVKGAQDGTFAADVLALTLRSDFRNVGRAASSAPDDADVPANGMTFYLDESGGNLKVRVRYSDGTYKTGTLSLA
jgi:hypothetical protein